MSPAGGLSPTPCPGSQRVRGPEGPAPLEQRGLENGCGLRVEEQSKNNKPSEVMCFSLSDQVRFSIYDGISLFKKTEG